MIEKTILDYLNNALPVSCYMEMPKGSPHSQFVVIEKTGSSTENHITTSTLAVQSYAQSMYGAAQLNETVKGMMELAYLLPSISRCELNSDYNFTDTGMKQYRYQAVFEITHYE